MPRYCIIGAGAAGLATMHALAERGLDFDCFEASDRVGGHWHTDYDCLHLITPRADSGFSGDPMPEHWPDFPRRDLMVEYLEDYADRHGLRERVTFGTRVEHLAPVGSDAIDGWDVTTSDGATRRYDGVLVANGHNSVPSLPEVPGSFDGPQLHSSEYSNPDDLVGDRILVVGSGNSGCDIASELAQTGHDVVLSMRSGHLFQPKAFFGRPRGSLPIMKLPPRLLDLTLRALIRLTVGRPEDYGLPTPRSRDLAGQPPVVNSLVLHWIQHGRINPAPTVECLDGTTVAFTDGTKQQVDSIVWATGFKAVLPFLPDELVARRDGVPLRVAGAILPADGPGRLYYIGLCAPRGPQLPVYSEQASLVLDMLDLQEDLDTPLVRHFDDHPHEDRIDMVRSDWKQQMSATTRRVRSLAADAAQHTTRRPVEVGR